jgi:hypothetical protein
MLYAQEMKALRMSVVVLSLLAFFAGNPAVAALASAGLAVHQETLAAGATGQDSHDMPCHTMSRQHDTSSAQGCPMSNDGPCHCPAAAALPTTETLAQPAIPVAAMNAGVVTALCAAQPQRLLRPPSA